MIKFIGGVIQLVILRKGSYQFKWDFSSWKGHLYMATALYNIIFLQFIDEDSILTYRPSKLQLWKEFIPGFIF